MSSYVAYIFFSIIITSSLQSDGALRIRWRATSSHRLGSRSQVQSIPSSIYPLQRLLRGHVEEEKGWGYLETSGNRQGGNQGGSRVGEDPVWEGVGLAGGRNSPIKRTRVLVGDFEKGS